MSSYGGAYGAKCDHCQRVVTTFRTFNPEGTPLLWCVPCFDWQMKLDIATGALIKIKNIWHHAPDCLAECKDACEALERLGIRNCNS